MYPESWFHCQKQTNNANFAETIPFCSYSECFHSWKVGTGAADLVPHCIDLEKEETSESPTAGGFFSRRQEGSSGWRSQQQDRDE